MYLISSAISIINYSNSIQILVKIWGRFYELRIMEETNISDKNFPTYFNSITIDN